MRIPHQDRLEVIWKRLFDLTPHNSPEAREEKMKLLAEMDELDPAGIGLLETIREPWHNPQDEAQEMADLEKFAEELNRLD